MNEPSQDDREERLAKAVRQVRNDFADREDVVVELRESQRARLEILLDELEDVIADIPEDHHGFDFAISAGAQPRLWIDPVAHVTMGRDRRTYRFLREGRAGRVVLAESHDPKPIAAAVTLYVAERIVERRIFLEGAPAVAEGAPRTDQATEGVTGAGRRDMWVNIALFLVGLAAGAVSVLAILRDRVPELQGFF